MHLNTLLQNILTKPPGWVKRVRKEFCTSVLFIVDIWMMCLGPPSVLALCSYAGLLLLTAKANVNATCPMQQIPSSLAASTKNYADAKFQGNNTTRLRCASEVTCYQHCLAECLCYFANYKEVAGPAEQPNCELVKYASSAHNDTITLASAKGWSATKFGRVRMFSSWFSLSLYAT